MAIHENTESRLPNLEDHALIGDADKIPVCALISSVPLSYRHPIASSICIFELPPLFQETCCQSSFSLMAREGRKQARVMVVHFDVLVLPLKYEMER